MLVSCLLGLDLPGMLQAQREIQNPRIISMLRGGVLVVTVKKGVDEGPLGADSPYAAVSCNLVRPRQSTLPSTALCPAGVLSISAVLLGSSEHLCPPFCMLGSLLSVHQRIDAANS